MTFELDLAPAAEADIDTILDWSVVHFGEAVRDGYEELINAAFGNILVDPNCAGSHDRPDLGSGVRSLHLKSSRNSIKSGVRRIARPRHFVFYRQVGNTIQVVRILHETMNISRQHIEEV